MIYSGEFLVKIARETIQTYLSTNKKLLIPKNSPKDLFDQSGVFVTLHRFTKEEKKQELRGCIGRIESTRSSLIQSTIDSAIDSAIHDPRFPPVTYDEMDNITVEITILTVPNELKVKDPQEYFNLIIIGKHGLIVQKGYQRGLLLPQVPIENNWDLETYLNWVCMKANLPPQAWRNRETKIFSFKGLIFSEKTPNGDIIQKKISE